MRVAGTMIPRNRESAVCKIANLIQMFTRIRSQSTIIHRRTFIYHLFGRTHTHTYICFIYLGELEKILKK